MVRHAVCYTATSGYLFHTVFSATQARANTAADVEIHVCFLGDGESDEAQSFRRVCDMNGIELATSPLSAIEGLHPMYARLFLDRLLPEHVDEVLYLDGDTQVVRNIDALVKAVPPRGGALAVRDPMVFIRRTDVPLRRKIDSWWDEGEIPADVRVDYVNSGVLRIGRGDIGPLREEVVKRLEGSRPASRFPDQDAINIALHERLKTISMRWNFPGFLLDTRLADLAPPRIIHFMSDPRPWGAAFSPWGEAHFGPYRKFAHTHPEIARYWERLVGGKRIRYALQQRYKHRTERRLWQSSAAARVVSDLERTTYQLD